MHCIEVVSCADDSKALKEAGLVAETGKSSAQRQVKPQMDEFTRGGRRNGTQEGGREGTVKEV